MQNVDELKSRVEETAEKLRAFQEGRNGQSQSLVEMLGQLEEKYAAQSVELEYCRERVAPLEAANTQLALLMESLLDTIDAGFANIESDPLQKAAEIAGSMLNGDMSPEPQDTNEVVSEVIADEAIGLEENETSDEITAEESGSDDETELSVFDEGNVDLPKTEAPVDAEPETAIDPEMDIQFEDVSEAALELESEEDAPTADLPESVVAAIAETDAIENAVEDVVAEITEELVSDELVLEDEADAVADVDQTENAVADPVSTDDIASEDDIESVAALAQEIEEEAAATDDKPAASDIRALLERVEALAAKAGAMGGDELVEPTQETAVDDSEEEQPRKAGAAA